ncbi:MAG: branched-chain amino acid aminotransferase [Candidatus Marinimicrobia bacterium]|nr:branched-chain amino acid aminotransferase [Candidatus Neomarinimicrobiota bacterium]
MNGKFVPEDEAKISIFDSALMFGDMVFEMTRSFNGEQWKLREHLERLYSGIKILRIPLKLTIDEMEAAVYEIIDRNKPAFNDDDEHRVLIDVTRGLLSLYQGIEGTEPGPNVIIADFPLRWTIQGCSKLYDTGINLVIPSQRAIPAHLMEPKIKNRSRLFYLMANIEVSLFKGENNWALMVDPDGFITEGTGSNFFMVKDNTLYTPEGRNVLRGITMQTVIKDLAPQLNIDVVQKNIEPFDVYEADEAFLTSTPFCLIPAVKLNGLKIGDGKPGKITQSLLKKWSDIVDVDIAGQIKAWDKNAEGDDAPSPYKFATDKNATLTMDISED